ncbi:hypothetical protein BSKO_05242 [Bryopsis sp. KO-2023]|nr:hypothetical protein BSKO_05242 [Bryopsis sp. KO-2023]
MHNSWISHSRGFPVGIPVEPKQTGGAETPEEALINSGNHSQNSGENLPLISFIHLARNSSTRKEAIDMLGFMNKDSLKETSWQVLMKSANQLAEGFVDHTDG